MLIIKYLHKITFKFKCTIVLGSRIINQMSKVENDKKCFKNIVNQQEEGSQKPLPIFVVCFKTMTLFKII